MTSRGDPNPMLNIPINGRQNAMLSNGNSLTYFLPSFLSIHLKTLKSHTVTALNLCTLSLHHSLPQQIHPSAQTTCFHHSATLSARRRRRRRLFSLVEGLEQ